MLGPGGNAVQEAAFSHKRRRAVKAARDVVPIEQSQGKIECRRAVAEDVVARAISQGDHGG